MPSNDHAVYTISKYKEKLELYYKVITPELNIIENIYDKVKLIESAKKLNIPVPVTQVIKSIENPLERGLNYPVITKGRNGLSFYRAIGKKILLAKNENELKKQLGLISERYSIDRTFTQELIPFNGNNYTLSFTAFCVNGKIKARWSGEKLREHPFRFGTATFTRSITNDSLYQQSKPLLEELNYTGVCEVEYIQDPRDEKYKLIEINPRTWLWVGLAKECGVDYAKMIYNYVNHKSINYFRNNLTAKYWLNPVTDSIFSIISLLKGKLNFSAYISSLLTKNIVNALFMKGDMKPGWMYLMKVSSFLRQR